MSKDGGSVLILDTKLEAERKAKQIPQPTGYHILCMIPKIDDTYGDSGLLKASETIRVEEQATLVLYVAKLGPQAYADKTRFPDGAWCKEGDFVITRAYAGTRVLIHGTEWRIINDDTVEAVVDDPRGIRRA
jgi:co-chaperonin GroES (HSP10)